MKPNGYVIYRGPSVLDGEPIVAIVTGVRHGSANRKTGEMLQTYILRADVEPTAAIKTGADRSICGDCPHRGVATGTRAAGRTCYVNVGQGPLNVYRAYKRDRYPFTQELGSLGSARIVRLGTYGDPAAVPAEVWYRLVARSTGHTGYTHQWRNVNQRIGFSQLNILRELCMASVDGEAEAQEAQSLGWRTFRVAMPGDMPIMRRESVCPASAEAGRKLTCAQCLACAGANGRKGSIVIQAHGGTAVMANIRRKQQ